MFHKLTLAAVAALSLLTPLALPAPVQARHDVHTRHIPQRHHYHVMYRACQREPWVCYGTYTCHEDAHRVARSLRHQGYTARVEHH
jgi:hypothetical protein